MERPLGVTILSVLGFIGGVLTIMGGVAVFILGPVMSLAIKKMYAAMPFFTAIIGILSIVLIVMGVVGLIISYGLWTGKSWAWWIYLILLVLGILSGLASLPSGLVGIAINGVIIYYITRKHVKAYFGIV